MSDSCVEGHRKKAKYLLDDDELGKPISTLHHELLLIHSFLREEALRRSKEAAKSLTHEEMEQDLQPHQVDLKSASLTARHPFHDILTSSSKMQHP